MVEVVEAAPGREPEAPGYQVNAATMLWVAGDGETVAPDPIRVPRAPKEGRKPNRFFLDFYRNAAGDGRGLRAREHTAQVQAEVRQEREQSSPTPACRCCSARRPWSSASTLPS